MRNWAVSGTLAILGLCAGFAAYHFYSHKTFREGAVAPSALTQQAVAAPPVLPLWDFTTSHGDVEGPPKPVNILVPVKIRQEINAAIVRQGGPSDEVSVFSVSEGTFTEGAPKQKLYTTWQFGPNMVENTSFFALYTNGKLKLIRNQYEGRVLRTIRLPDADVDYLVLDADGGSNGDNLDYLRVVSLRDGELPKVIADVGLTSDDYCASATVGASWVASKVFYRPAGTAMEILPFDQYSQRCVANAKPTFLKTTKDDAQKTLLALMKPGGYANTSPSPTTSALPEANEAPSPAEILASETASNANEEIWPCRTNATDLCLDGFQPGMSSGQAIANATRLGFKVNQCEPGALANAGYNCKFVNADGRSLELSWAFGQLFSADEGAREPSLLPPNNPDFIEANGEPDKVLGLGTRDELHEWKRSRPIGGEAIMFGHSSSRKDYYALIVDGYLFKTLEAQHCDYHRQWPPCR
jgi:hypothetical protein